MTDIKNVVTERTLCSNVLDELCRYAVVGGLPDARALQLRADIEGRIKNLRKNNICKARKDRLEAQRQEKNRKSALTAVNARQKWTSREDAIVCNSMSVDQEISRMIGRSIKAIRVRRVRLRNAG